MSDKIRVSKNKILKLNNVLVKEINLTESGGLEKEIMNLENYLKNKGAQPLGPLIQYTNITYINNEPKVVIKLLRQSDKFIHNIKEPYVMRPIIRVKNCMYARYSADKDKLKFAYDKINLIAFEEDISLKGDSYTIFVSEKDNNIIADVFMEQTNNE